MTGTPPSSDHHRIPQWFLYLLMGVEMTNLGLLLPVLPEFIAQGVGSGKVAAIWYGVSSFLFGMGFLIGSAVTGPWSDRYGRRPFLLGNCAGLAVGHLLAATSPSIVVFVLARMWTGLFNSNIALAQAYMADLSTTGERGRRFGLLGAMQGLGFIIGPILGGYLGHQNPRIPFLVAGIASAVLGLLAAWLLKESLPSGMRWASPPSLRNPFRILRDLVRLPGFGPLVPALGLLTLSQNVMITSWVPYATVRFGWGPRENGWGLFTFGVFSALAQGLVFPVLLKRLNPARICLGAMASSSLTYAAFGWTHDGVVALILLGANVVGFTGYMCFQTLASNRTDAEHQGGTLGGLQALNNLTLVLAPFFTSGLLYAMLRWRESEMMAGLPMFFCSGLVALALVLSCRYFLGNSGPQSEGSGSGASPER